MSRFQELGPVRSSALWLGVTLIAFGLLVDPIRGRPFDLGAAQIFVLLAGVCLVAAALLGRRVRDVYNNIATLSFAVVIVVACVEGASRIAMSLRRSTDGYSLTSSAYLSQREWGRQHIADMDHLKTVYMPFSVWRTAELRSNTINVDALGVRLTPASDCANARKRVFLFGGSTMWGVGAPDSATIAARIQASLRARSITGVCIVNRGEIGFTSTQELILFQQLLQAGQVPDGVVFYDGINDVSTATLSGRAATHFELARIAARVEGGAGALREYLNTSATARLIQEIARGHKTIGQTRPEAGQLRQAVVAAYRANQVAIRAIAEARGIPVAFFWQPVLYSSRKPLTDGERYWCAGESEGVHRFFRGVYRDIAALHDSMPQTTDISDVLDNMSLPAYVDFFHTTPEANTVIADAIVRALVSDSSWAGVMGGARASGLAVNKPQSAARTATACADAG